MARSNSGPIVAGITAAALAVVTFLAYQASATAPDDLSTARRDSSQSTDRRDGSGDDSDKQEKHPLPAASGNGVRVVYALDERRVWLVGQDDKVARTYPVTPSTVSPEPGQYAVTSRSARIAGSDGVPVEHVVRFTTVDGVVVGFSAAVNGEMPDPGSDRKTGGIREERADGKAMWTFATIGTKIVVVD
ncbi:L,D-transpeptidase [Streptomyces sp. NPDC047108]|uniref:L,D-transpeptidase n=1 Tax=Streptomyces sp. NPDC047108 TaxID=3155025 RepID=UPI0033E04EB0